MPTGVFPWWLVLIEGIAAIIIGVLLLLAPQATLELVLQLFALYWVVDGVVRLASAFTDPVDRGLKITMGTAGVLAGIAVIRHPALLAVLLTYMVVGLLGFAGVAIGVLSLIQASRGGGWGAAIGGVLSFLFGLLILVNPFLSGTDWAYLYAGASLIGGQVGIGDASTARAVFEVIFWSPLALSAALVPAMVARGKGAVVNVTSTIQAVPLPLLAYYGSSKAALTQATRSLRLESAETPIRVVEVVLAATDTTFRDIDELPGRRRPPGRCLRCRRSRVQPQ